MYDYIIHSEKISPHSYVQIPMMGMTQVEKVVEVNEVRLQLAVFKERFDPFVSLSVTTFQKNAQRGFWRKLEQDLPETEMEEVHLL